MSLSSSTGGSRRSEALELRHRLTRIALALPELGRVDLEETDAFARAHVERVAVADARDDGTSVSGTVAR